MTDVFREVDEALREDRAKAFWKRYNAYIIAGAILIVVLVGGYNLWIRYQTERNEQQTDRLMTALLAADSDPQAALDQLSLVIADGDSDHATLARLYEAGMKAKQGDQAAAAAAYRAVEQDGGAPQVWRDMARLLAVMHDLDSGDPAALTQELAPLTGDASPWRFSARELTALLALRQGNTAEAGQQFAALAADDQAPAGIRQRAGELANFLGVKPVEPAGAAPDAAAPAPETPS